VTSLKYAVASLSITGNWVAFSGFSLHQLTLAVLMMPKSSQLDETTETLKVQVKGLLNFTSGSDTRTIGVVAVFNKQDNMSTFTARLTAQTDTEDDGDGEASQIDMSPNDLLALPALGGQAIQDTVTDLIPADFPVQEDDIIKAPTIECSLNVSKGTDEQWALSCIMFSLRSDKSWDVIPGSLSLLNPKLTLILSDISSAKRTTDFTANTTIQIGSIALDASLRFKMDDGKKGLLFNALVRPEDVSPAVKQLTGYEFSELIPADTPGLDRGGATLQLSITCCSVSDGKGGLKYALQALSVDFAPDQTWSISPFVINRLRAIIIWKAGTDMQNIMVQFAGQVACNNVPVSITLSYDSKMKDIINFELKTINMHPLLASDLTTISGVTQPTLDATPQDYPDFTGLSVVRVSGLLKLGDSKASQSSLWTLDAYIESTKSIPVLLISNDISVVLERFGLLWKYRADPAGRANSGQVYAYLVMGAGSHHTDVPLFYSRSADGTETYAGQIVVTDDSQSVDYTTILQQFLPKGTYDVKSQLQVPDSVPMLNFSVTLDKGKSVAISASGKIGWQIPFDSVDIRLDQAGVDLSVQLGAAQQNNSYHVCLTGNLTLNAFQTARNLRVQLDISCRAGTNAVLTGILTKQTTGVNDLEVLSSQLDDTSWSNIIPTGSQNMNAFNLATPLIVYIDFVKHKMLLAGQLPNGGGALFLARKSQDGQKTNWVLSLSVTSLSTLFDWGNSGIGSTFDLSPINVSVMAYDGTAAELLADIRQSTQLQSLTPDTSTVSAGTSAATSNTTDTTPPRGTTTAQPSTDPSKGMLTVLPADTALRKGVWFFAGVQILGDESTHPMSQTLTDCLNPGTTPTIWLYGCAAADTKEFGLAITQLVVLGGALQISGSGTYVQQTLGQTTDGTLTVHGTVEFLQLATDSNMPLSLTLDVTAKTNSVTFSAAAGAKTPGKITNPFGAMFNVTLELVSLQGTISKVNGQTSSQFTLKGRATFSHGDGKQMFDADIVFATGGAPTLVVFSMPPINVDIVFQQLIEPDPGAGVTPGMWPSTYPDFSLKDAQLWYAKQDTVFNGVVLVQGYHAEATITVFDCDFRVRLDLPGDRSGVIMSSTFVHPIDLHFMRLNNPSLMIHSQGPTVRIGLKAYKIRSLTWKSTSSPS
jgi:hypothetical protein